MVSEEHIETSDWNRKLRDHIFNYRQGAEKANWKWEESLNTQSNPSITHILQRGSDA